MPSRAIIHKSAVPILAVVCLSAFTACSSSKSGTPSKATANQTSTTAESTASGTANSDCVSIPSGALIKAGTIQVGVNATLPPLAYQDSSGKLQGYRIELADALAKILCVKPVFTNTAPPTMPASLDAKRLDMTDIGYFVTDARIKVMEMIPTEQTAVSLVAPKGNPENLKSLDDLAGKSVGIVTATYEASVIQAMDKASVAQGKAPMKFQTFDNYDILFTALQAKKVDAAVTVGPTAKYYSDKGGFSIVVDGVKPTPAALTVRGGNDGLANALVEALTKFKASGDYAKLIAKYNLTPIDQFKVHWAG